MAEDCDGIYKYDTCLKSNTCEMFSYVPENYRCQFVIDTEDCDDEFMFIYYMYLFGCIFGPEQRLYFGIPIIFCVLFLLFLILSVTADMFFAPSLCAISDKCKMSENLAGVTLLAFGNACTDVITSMVEVDKDGVPLVLSHQLGGGLFVLVFVAGIVILHGSFTVESWELLRDIGFTIIAFVSVVAMSSTRRLYVYSGLLLISLYVVYVICFVVENIVRRRRLRKMTERPMFTRLSAWDRLSRVSRARRASRVSRVSRGMITRRSNLPGLPLAHGSKTPSPTSVKIIKSSSSYPLGADNPAARESLREEIPKVHLTVPQEETAPHLSDDISEEIEREPLLYGHQVLPPPVIPRPRSVSVSNYADNILMSERLRVLRDAGREEQAQEERQGLPEAIGVEIGGNLYKTPQGLCSDFLHEIIPFDEEEWDESKFIGKTMIILRIPIVFCLKFIIPTVNHTALKNGWCKLLNTMHCVTSVIFLFFAFGIYNLQYPQLITITITMLVACICTAVLVFVTSEQNRPPPYHLAFAILGFVVSFSVIYVTAVELVNLIIALGHLLRVSVVTLGLTLLAIGNNIGDLVADVALAKEGYSKMGFAGSFGATLFSTLLGTGISFLYLAVPAHGKYVFSFNSGDGGLLFNAYFFIILALVAYLLCVPTMGFSISKIFGVFLVVLYGMFIAFAIFCEFDIVDSLASDL